MGLIRCGRFIVCCAVFGGYAVLFIVAELGFKILMVSNLACMQSIRYNDDHIGKEAQIVTLMTWLFLNLDYNGREYHIMKFIFLIWSTLMCLLAVGGALFMMPNGVCKEYANDC